MFNNKTVLITGGTGHLGKSGGDSAHRYKLKRLIVFSRMNSNNTKQQQFSENEMRYF